MSKYSSKVQDVLNRIANGQLVMAQTSVTDDAASGKRIIEFRGPEVAHFTLLIVEKGNNTLETYDVTYQSVYDLIFEKHPDGSYVGTGNAKGYVSVQAYLPNP